MTVKGLDALPLTLTLAETADQLRLSKRSVEALVASGELPSFKMGKSRRVARRALIDYIEKKSPGDAA